MYYNSYVCVGTIIYISLWYLRVELHKSTTRRTCPLKRGSDGIGENSGDVQLLTLERRAADREAYESQVYARVLRGDAKSYATKSSGSHVLLLDR